MTRRSVGLVLVFILAAWLGATPRAAFSAEAPLHLLLDTVINGSPTNTIVDYVQFPDGTIAASVADLKALGLKVERPGPSTTLVKLSSVPTLTYRYDERAQRISINIASAYQRPLVLDIHAKNLIRPQTPRADWGAVLNYDLFVASSNLTQSKAWSFSGASLTLDGRAFSPVGDFDQTALASVDGQGRAQTIRLNSTFTYADPAHLTVWTAGDTISGATSWSRPIRIGGFQVQSKFALRPDLVTTPMASLGGTAAVPSTVDLFVNNVRTYSQDVGPGPFNLINVPLINGAGNAQVVIRNASGQTVAASLPFFSSPSLLAPGLNGWSFEVGLPRTSFGASNDAYAKTPAVSATWNHGAWSWLTFGGHAETDARLINGGLNVIYKTGTVGVASSAFTQSSYRGKTGSQFAFNYETYLNGFSLTAGVQRTFGDYEDLASTTARSLLTAVKASPLVYLSGATATSSDQAILALYDSARAPTQIDHVTASGAVFFDPRANWSLSYVPTRLGSGEASRPLSASYSRTLPRNASFFLTAFRDFATAGSTGVFFGFNLSLGPNSISADISASGDGTTSTVQATRPLGLSPGDVGWSLRDSEGSVPFREVDGSIRTTAATLRLGVQQSQAAASSTIEATGAVATIRGRFFASDRIDDAFAVVDAGAPGVAITSENRPIGKTDASGLLLVPTLRSFQNNSIEMNPDHLPVDTQIQSTRQLVTPADHAGVMISFAIKRDTSSALVTFVDEGGNYIRVGSAGRLKGGGEFVLGYDGQAFLNKLKASNQVTIGQGLGECWASFDFRPTIGQQVRIGPVVCHQTVLANASPKGAPAVRTGAVTLSETESPHNIPKLRSRF